MLCRVNQAQLQLLLDRTPSTIGGLGQAHFITSSALQECGQRLNQTLSQLYAHMENVENGLSVSSSSSQASRTQIRVETQTLQSALAHEAKPHDHDSHQMRLRSITCSGECQSRKKRLIYNCPTIGDVLEVKQATAGDRAVQIIGGFSDITLQRMLKGKSLGVN